MEREVASMDNVPPPLTLQTANTSSLQTANPSSLTASSLPAIARTPSTARPALVVGASGDGTNGARLAARFGAQPHDAF